MTVSIDVCWRQTASRRYSCKSRGKFAIRLQRELGRSFPRLIAEIVRKSCCLSNSSSNFDYSCSDNTSFQRFSEKFNLEILGIFKITDSIDSGSWSPIKESKNINETKNVPFHSSSCIFNRLSFHKIQLKKHGTNFDF